MALVENNLTLGKKVQKKFTLDEKIAVPDPEPGKSSGSGARKKFRIQEKVRDPNLERSSRSNLNYFNKIMKMPYKFYFLFKTNQKKASTNG